MSVLTPFIKLRFLIFPTLFLVCAAQPALAQFSSGSTGTDGAFSPATSQTIQVPASGVFNFTTVTIPGGVVITFARNSANTPVTILATGDVIINGHLNLDAGSGQSNGNSGAGGPGGYNGGKGGYPADASAGTSGEGPGGGCGGAGSTSTVGGNGGGGGYASAGADGGGTNPAGGQGGAKYGSALLLPLTGGSGGGGGGGHSTNNGSGGGGGGGAILIASSGAIRFGSPSGSGYITALGGGNSGTGGQGAGGCGSGGAIRLVANTITGNHFLWVYSNCNGAPGYIRLEAYDFTGITGQLIPLSSASKSVPNPVTLTNPPQLKIKKVAGINSPTSPKGSFQAAPDITVPSSQSNPVTVELEGVKVPVGTLVQVTVIPEAGMRTSVQSSALAGTFDLSTATAQVTLPAGTSVITASATVELLASADIPPMFIEGERVAKIEVIADFGGESDVVYVTKSGRRIAASSIR